MEENLVFAVFCMLPLVAGGGLYLVFGRYHWHESKSGRWWKLFAGNLVVFIFVLSTVALTGEIYFRFCYDTTDAFGMTKTTDRWFSRYYQVNNMGVRDNQDYFNRRTQQQRRITFIGDSFTAGHGIRNVEDRFANLIRRRHPEWEVHIMAENGLSTRQELSGLNDLVNHYGYELDQVVLVYCLNDVIDAQIGHERYYRKKSFLIENSFLLNTLYYRLWRVVSPELLNYFRRIRDIYMSPAWKTHAAELKDLNNLVRSHGGQLYVVTFPFLDFLGPDYEFYAVHRKLDDFWRSIDVPHLDLLPAFSQYRPRELMVNSHDAHPNEFANSLAANAITLFLEGRLPRAKDVPDSHGDFSPEDRSK